jgi:hypothetical protein
MAKVAGEGASLQLPTATATATAKINNRVVMKQL